jgi:hypothetical protein
VTHEQADPAAQPQGRPPEPSRGRRARLRGAVVQIAVLLAAGVVVGVAWRLLTPAVAGGSDGAERALAGEVTLAGLGALAGLVLAIEGLVRRGPRAPARFGVALAGSQAGSAVAWGVGRLLGAPVLAAPGVLLVWPLALCLVTVLVTLAVLLIAPPGD